MRLRILALGLAVAACDGYELVSLPANRSPELYVWAQVTQDDSTQRAMGALFVRGTDVEGRLLGPSDGGELTVNGTAIRPLPEATLAPREWRFIWETPRTAAPIPLDALALRVPPSDADPRSALSLTLPLPSREGPFDASAPATGDLQLPIRVPDPSANLGRPYGRWFARLCDRESSLASARLYAVEDSGSVHPTAVRIPRAVLEEVGEREFLVCFFSTFRYDVVERPYRARMHVNAYFEWRVRGGTATAVTGSGYRVRGPTGWPPDSADGQGGRR